MLIVALALAAAVQSVTIFGYGQVPADGHWHTRPGIAVQAYSGNTCRIQYTKASTGWAADIHATTQKYHMRALLNSDHGITTADVMLARFVFNLPEFPSAAGETPGTLYGAGRTRANLEVISTACPSRGLNGIPKQVLSEFMHPTKG